MQMSSYRFPLRYIGTWKRVKAAALRAQVTRESEMLGFPSTFQVRQDQNCSVSSGQVFSLCEITLFSIVYRLNTKAIKMQGEKKPSAKAKNEGDSSILSPQNG